MSEIMPENLPEKMSEQVLGSLGRTKQCHWVDSGSVQRDLGLKVVYYEPVMFMPLSMGFSGTPNNGGRGVASGVNFGSLRA